jgi:hypothetical protein
MRAKPPKTHADLQNLLPIRPPINGGQQPTADQGHPDLDTHERPDKLFADPLSRADGLADQENRDLADAIRTVFKASRKPVDGGIPRFVLTWRMYPNTDSEVAGTPGNCGCGCSCT